jgi:hypothetical protein
VTAVSIAEASRELDVEPATVRRWLREGAPCARPGGRGPGRGALVVVEDLQRWRERSPEVVMQKVAAAIVDTLRRDAGEGEPAHRTLGIRAPAAAALLAMAFERIHRAVTGRDAAELPAEIERAVFVLADSRP